MPVFGNGTHSAGRRQQYTGTDKWTMSYSGDGANLGTAAPCTSQSVSVHD